MSVTRLAEAIRTRKVSCVEATTAYFRRISVVNPKINAVVALCADRARAEAKAASVPAWPPPTTITSNS
jgi:amidase